MRSALSAVAALIVGVGSLPAQQPLPSIGSVYQPGIDVLDYDVRLVLPDTGAFLRGDVTVTVRRAPSMARLRLDLVDSMHVRAVEVDGRRVSAPHVHSSIDVPLPAGAVDSVRVRVVYDGVLRDGLIVRKDDEGRWTWFGDNWPDRTRHWLPTVDHPSDKATVSWTIRSPERNVVVANGASVGARHVTAGGRRLLETRWRESRPIPPYLMVIAAAPLIRHDLPSSECHRGENGECVQQSVYLLPENRALLPGVFAVADRIMSLFERLVAPFPYEKLAHLQSSTRFGGMENASAIFYNGAYVAQQKLSEATIAHEMAHQWFGDAVTEREWAHLWLSEGFADYFTALWAREAGGDPAYRAQLAKLRAKVLADSVVARRPVIDTAQTDYMALLNANSYDKGGFVLSMLHRELGDSAFFRGIRSYYAAHRHGNATSDDVRVALERSSGRSLVQFFDQWLRRPGYAQPSLGWAYDASKGTVTVLALQEGRFGAFALPLTVVVTGTDDVPRRLVVDIPAEPRATVPLPGRFARRPTSIAFDPDSMLLARISRL
ncbi:MAG TPA: M1 family metallopeptidase [Gemmatimonadaceae bacterium]|nr:M1 family metallopeptidase [Gemmatimonadaceae bacterium]